MDIQEYQDLADKLSSQHGVTRTNEAGSELVPIERRKLRLLMAAIGLCEEAGEFAGLIKKHVFHDHPLDINKVTKELGDTEWYLSEAATASALQRVDILAANIRKLRVRYGEKFSAEASVNRRSEEEEDDAASNALMLSYE